jgi:hypothetical protein
MKLRTGRGAGGAKGGGRGERGPAKHAPDAEPGACDPGAGPRTVSAPRRGQLAVLTACADAMRDLPLRKMPEEVILASQRRGIR